MASIKKYFHLHATEAGFSLIELSVIITVVALILTSTMILSEGTADKDKYHQTVTKMAKIEEILKNYILTFNRLPCAASPQTTFSSPTFGVEQRNATNCTSGNGVLSYTVNPDGFFVYQGMLPVKTLGLSSDYALDGWGRKFSYIVTSRATRYDVPSFGPGGSVQAQNSKGDISIDVPSPGNCSNSATLIADSNKTPLQPGRGALYALLSHGPNGHGAYLKKGGTVRVGASINNALERENSHYTSSNVSDGSFNNCLVYSDKEIVGNTASPATTTFDDILVNKTRWWILGGSM